MTTNFSRREFILLGSGGFTTSLLLQACSNPTTPTATTTGGAEGFKIAIANRAQAAMQEFDIRANGIDIKVSQLSGGNQQKVVLARELAQTPALIIAMQPTRGLDVGATIAVQSRILTERDRGAAILYISFVAERIIHQQPLIYINKTWNQILEVLND